jgi:hypothetical protein
MYRKYALVITQNSYFSFLLRFTKNHIIGNCISENTVTDNTVTDNVIVF